MIHDAERTRLQTLFSDTISLLCRSGLPGASARRVDALIGVTLDSQEVVLVNVSENFVCQNEHQAYRETSDKKNSAMPSAQMSEKNDILGACRYSVKEEHETDNRKELCNSAALDEDGYDGSDISAPTLHGHSQESIEPIELLPPQCTNRDSAVDCLLPETMKTSAPDSDDDCLLIKTELQEDNTGIDNTSPSRSENFTSGIDMPPVPGQRSISNSSRLRIKHVQSMQRRARWNQYGSKFYRPPQKYSTAHHSAFNPSQSQASYIVDTQVLRVSRNTTPRHCAHRAEIHAWGFN